MDFMSNTGVPGKFIIVRQDKGIITFSEVQVNPGTYIPIISQKSLTS